jgi:tripartite-type tricarboxylate transporter receptor subunit TctC
MKLIYALLLAIVFAIAPCEVLAQYPAKAITIVVFTPPGGPSDTAARTLAQRMSKALGQQIVIDNRPGAEGSIAAQAVLKAAPDGYMMLWGSGSMIGIPFMQKTPPFQSMSEFAPVSSTARFAFGMYVHPSVPATTVAEFVAHARANAGKLSYATGPLSEFIAASVFLRETGLTMTRIPYKGGAQAMPDVVAGRVQLYFTPISIGQSYAQSGRLRMLATLLPERSPLTPDVPTIAEAGIKNMWVPAWNAIFAPPKTPREITARIAREVQLGVKDPEVRSAYEQRGVQGVGSTPDELAATVAQDTALWKQFVQDNKLEAQ